MPSRHRPTRLIGVGTALGIVVVGLLLIAGAARAGYTTYRFDHDAETADAVILDSDLGCITAIGAPGGTGGSGTITYTIEFAYRAATHRTEVTRPCGVIPPDFGRGRGKIWIQYDREQPDRTRVLGDDTARLARNRLGAAAALYTVSVVVITVLIRSRRTPSDRSEPPAVNRARTTTLNRDPPADDEEGAP